MYIINQVIIFALCFRNKVITIKYMIMNADIFTDAEVLTMLDNVLNQPSIEDIERNRARRRRVAKADFFNLKEVTSKDKFMNL